MTQLLLIRHGQSTYNAAGRIQGWADPPLDETGLGQARRLAERLACEGSAVSAIYSSPLLRARQTAESIGQALSLAAQTDERLKENNVGLITGMTWTEIEQRFPEWVALGQRSKDHWVMPPGAEDRAAFAARAAAAMKDIVTRHPDQTVAVVSHIGTLSIYLAQLLEMPLHRRFPFQFDNTSLSIVKVTETRVRLLKLNDTAHLNGKR
jgi:probable phosphoglycerate mutase